MFNTMLKKSNSTFVGGGHDDDIALWVICVHYKDFNKLLQTPIVCYSEEITVFLGPYGKGNLMGVVS